MTEKPLPVPSGKLIAYTLPGADVDVEACIRPWMRLFVPIGCRFRSR